MNEISVELLNGDYGIRFAGPDLLYYDFLIMVKGSELDNTRIRIHSQFHDCCGVLAITAKNLDQIGRSWMNGYEGCEEHQHKEIGDKVVRNIVWGLSEYYQEREK